MRITHFLHRLPSQYSGAAIQAAALIRELAKYEDIESHLLAYAEGEPAADSSLPCKQTVVNIGRGIFGKITQLRRLFTALRADGSAVLHVHGFSLLVVLCGLLTAKRIVLKTTLLGVDDLRSLAKRYPVLLHVFILPRIGAVISLNHGLVKANSAAGARNYLIPNGVNWQELSDIRNSKTRESTLARYGIASGKLAFLYVGGDSVRKGFKDLPSFWQAIQEEFGDDRAHLFVVGRFTQSGSDKSLLENCGNRQSLTLIPTVVDLKPLYAACDVFVSLSTAEGLPNAVLEAVACNVFVLARSLPGVFDDLLDSNNSLLFDRFDAETVATLKRYVASGRHRAIDNLRFRPKFDMPAIAWQYKDLYERLVRSNGVSTRLTRHYF